MVVVTEVVGGDFRHQRLDLRNRDLLDAWTGRQRTGGDAGAAADHEHLGRMCRHQVRQVREQQLQPHVLGERRRLDLAGRVIVQLAARAARHGDELVQPFAGVEDAAGVRIPARLGPFRRLPAVGDEHAGHRRDTRDRNCDRRGGGHPMRGPHSALR